MLRFTIRDVLWLTVVVALGVGWFAHWRSWKANRPPEFVLRELKDLEAQVDRQQEMIQKLLGKPASTPGKPIDP